MPNGPVHEALGVVTALAVTAYDKKEASHPWINPITAIPAGMVLGKLPDLLEPATSPNHRKFCHSVAVLGLVGYGVKKTYEWEPESGFEKFLRGALLVGGACYAVHLLADATTPRSLPVM